LTTLRGAERHSHGNRAPPDPSADKSLREEFRTRTRTAPAIACRPVDFSPAAERRWFLRPKDNFCRAQDRERALSALHATSVVHSTFLLDKSCDRAMRWGLNYLQHFFSRMFRDRFGVLTPGVPSDHQPHQRTDLLITR